MIQFSCPNCGRSMKAQDGHAGKNGQCKQCGQNVTVPFPVLAPTSADLMAATVPEEKQELTRVVPCPMCGELISPAAKKCRFCNEFLDPAYRPQPEPKPKGKRAPEPAPSQQVTVINNVQAVANGRARKRYSPTLAFFLSVLIPGLGQLYAGRFLSAVCWFCFTVLGYVFIIPGIILHVLCAFSIGLSDPYR